MRGWGGGGGGGGGGGRREGEERNSKTSFPLSPKVRKGSYSGLG